ncbi:uncharacterized protein [Halyomorpha halys]|uniref:uncharacterized protein n=1 Tax=Halyomorpha halys TaxID=286706 RepID=UPI0034D36E3E
MNTPKVQNQALRIINGGVKSTPTLWNSKQVLNHYRIGGRNLLCVFMKSVCDERITCWIIAKETLHQIDLPTEERQNIISHKPKHDLAEVYVRLKLACGQIKKDCPEPVLRATALKTFYELYPIEQWLHNYTNESASSINKGTGAGVYSITFQLSFPVGAGRDYGAEMQAICFAMEATIECDENTVIFSDCQAVIQKLRTLGAAGSPKEESVETWLL